MPAEIRHIIFSEAELVRAVQHLYERYNETLPEGSIRGCKVSAEGGGRIVLDIENDGGTRRLVTLGKEKLAAALILFCKWRKVPLPAEARKLFRVVRGRMALVTAIGMSAEELEQLADLL